MTRKPKARKMQWYVCISFPSKSMAQGWCYSHNSEYWQEFNATVRKLPVQRKGK